MNFKDNELKKENSSYVYTHTRCDNGEVFYVGIGVHRKDKKYKRAYRKDRTVFWKNIVNKTDYHINIVEDNITWSSACLKEKELINYYGRKNLGIGTLVNLTNGGEGAVGRVYTHSAETRKKIGLNTPNKRGAEHHSFGKPMSESTKLKISKGNKGKKHTKEAILKIQISSKGRAHTKESKAKISKANKGRERTAIWLERSSLSHKGQKHSDEQRAQQSLSRRGSKHPMSRLKESDVLFIRELFSNINENKKQLAKIKKQFAAKFSVSTDAIRNIINRKSWTHI